MKRQAQIQLKKRPIHTDSPKQQAHACFLERQTHAHFLERLIGGRASARPAGRGQSIRAKDPSSRGFSIRRAAAWLVLLVLVTALQAPLPVHAAGSATFSITGPSTLAQGATGTYVVKVTVTDAAAAQAKLAYDSSFFELVSGNLSGIWDTADNTSTTATLTTVTLRCIAATGTSGVLSLTGVKASRLTGRLDSPTESVPCTAPSKTVSNPTPTTTQATTTQATTTQATTTQATTTKATTKATTTTQATATQATTTQTSATQATATTPGNATQDTSAGTGTSQAAPGSTTDPSSLLPKTTESGSATGAATSASTAFPPASWDTVRERIAGLPTGGAATIPRLADSRAPASVLQALKDKNARLTLDFGSYSWLIDGSLLNGIPPELPDIDLSLSMTADPAITQAAGGEAVYQLHFKHDGELPGRMVIRFPASQNKPGDRLYLYTYYGLAGVAQGIQTAVVNPDGTVQFELFHCSSYFVTNRVMASAINSFPTESLAGMANNGGTGSTGRGVSLPVLLLCMLGAALIAALAIMGVYKVGVFGKNVNRNGKWRF